MCVVTFFVQLTQLKALQANWGGIRGSTLHSYGSFKVTTKKLRQVPDATIFLGSEYCKNSPYWLQVISKCQWQCSFCYFAGHRNNTILHYACLGGRLELVQNLLKEGCPANKVNQLFETPLHMAAMAGTKGASCVCCTKEIVAVIPNCVWTETLDVLKALLDTNPALLNMRTVWGDTAAHYAGRWGAPQVLTFLLDEGIEVDKPQEKPGVFYTCYLS